eukprot:TRINITY_DN8534_c0_g1_i2.p1 TRINITY_DN8534_c0_g1~~TRINITY_DN8534_c0_g1_i2.p1  ORF type:complete len:163 (-),score=32.14 TRINITY_DN8534_c0_g1_i2:418-855(-)
MSHKAEFEDFLQNYNDPRFRELFDTFTRTFSDEEEKKKFLKEMAQLNSVEFDLLPTKLSASGVPVIRPIPGFCFKVKAESYSNYEIVLKDIFINVTHHHSIEPAKSNRNCSHKHTSNNPHKLPREVRNTMNYWKIPYSLSPPEKG